VWYAVTGTILRKNWWKAALPIFATQFFVMGLLGNWLPDLPAPTWMGAAEIARLQSRLTFGGIAIIFAVAVGYTCFAYVSIAEGRRYFRVHAEMALAAEIHRVLVPTIDIKSDGFEFYGRSLPSGEVGGDLVDVFQADRAGSPTLPMSPAMVLPRASLWAWSRAPRACNSRPRKKAQRSSNT
jgi:hypothetical protein